MSSTVIFPHTRLRSGLLERLCGTFGPLTLCQPWFSEPTVPHNLVETGSLKLRFPSERLKPKENFERLLSEYKEWMMDNRGKNSSGAFFTKETGDETWAIRKAIRDAAKDPGDPALADTLKWHLVLHLAQDLEADRETAQTLLQKAASAKSPLAEAMEGDEKIPDMFEDLPLSAASPYVTDRHLRLIFEAWLGLFGHELKADSELLTLDQQVITYAISLFDGCEVEAHWNPRSVQRDESFEETEFTIRRRVLPRLSTPTEVKDSVVQSLSGRTFVIVE